MDDVVLLDTVPPPDVLDRVLAESRALVVTAPPPARGVLVALAVERGVPCVATFPVGLEAKVAEQLVRRARGSLVPRIPGVDLRRLVLAAQRRDTLPDAWRSRLVEDRASPEGQLDWSRWSARVTDAREPSSSMTSLGLRATVTPAWNALLAPRSEAGLALPPLEAYAFERGLKPALYLSLPREEADGWAAHFARFAIATVDYDLEHDRVLDRRVRTNRPDGEGTHRDLFVAHDPALVNRAKAIYEDPRGPSEHLGAMGALLGYPACCIAAFESLDDRSNNTAIRYAAWRRTRALGYPFEALLDNLSMHLLPWFPCTYACAPSVEHARRIVASLETTHPDEARELARRLARPVLYFDHARSLAFEDATVDGETIRYGSVSSIAPGDATATTAFARSVGALFAAADTAMLGDPHRWVLSRGGTPIATIEREAAAPGALFPFGASS